MTMKNWTSIILIFTLLCTALLILPVHAATGVYDSVIRLHVLANSDSEEDQTLKLKVRDDVLSCTEELIGDATSRDEAEEILRENLDTLRDVAEKTLVREGAPNEVRVTLGEENYPRRAYETAALPAGEYLSLRVMIGEAEGQNWWCVLVPPMCLSAATSERETSCLAAGLSEGQYRFITGTQDAGYRVRFKLVEMAQELFD